MDGVLRSWFDKDGALAHVGRKHAADRLESGISLEQLVSEFRALRASVLRQWEKNEEESNGEVTRFNEAIDETLAESTARYSATVSSTRDQFLGILGHDLRNPIGAILMGASLLGDTDDKEQGEIAKTILRSAERMSRMVNDLLDLTRSGLGSGIPVTLKPIELNAVCEQVIDELQAMHPKVNLQFEGEGQLSGSWDGDRLAQAISNLIANAIQYGDTSQPITITAKAQEKNVDIEVHNAGEKIPDHVVKRIFTPMARYLPDGQVADTNKSGLGLGLYIASEIAASHGGSIKVKTSEGTGTSFTISLPRKPEKVLPKGKTGPFEKMMDAPTDMHC